MLVGAATLVDEIRTFQLALLTHPTSLAHHIPVIFCLPCVSYSYLSLLLWTSTVSSDLSRIIVYWTLLEWYESFLGVHCFLIYSVVWSCLHTRC